VTIWEVQLVWDGGNAHVNTRHTVTWTRAFCVPVCEADSRATVVAADEEQSDDDGEE